MVFTVVNNKELYVVFGSGGLPEQKLFPCSYLLLPNKAAVTYQNVLNILEDKTEHSPDEIYIDFEQAVVRASLFPGAKVCGCVFHWKKPFSNVGSKGCLQQFKTDENVQVELDLLSGACS